MARHYVDLPSLVTKSTTRERGDEAFDKLLPLLKIECVEVDLTHADILSISFLDELILRTAKENLLNSLIFITDAERLPKIERAFSMRNLEGKYRLRDDVTVRPIELKTILQDEPTVEERQGY